MSRLAGALTLLVALGILAFSYVVASALKAPPQLPEPAQEEVYQEASTTAPVASSSASVRIPIFIYHSVRPDFAGETASQKAFSLTPEQLEAQLRYLHDAGYTTISLTELAREVKAGTTSPIAKPVVLTFDDGDQNQFVYAFPLLLKYHDTATFFIYANPISKSPNFMTWDEVAQLVAAGMEIGDHTITHPYLQKLSDAQLRHEILDGKALLEQHLGITINHFASPFGYSNPHIEDVIKSGGFLTARTTYPGMHHAPANLLALTGYLVHRDLNDFIWAASKAP